MITHKRLLELIRYDPDSGIFIWEQSRGSVRTGSVAGAIRPDGYIRVHLDGKDYYAHRLAWFYMHGKWPTHDIDHINGQRSDNRISNLRDVCGSINAQNLRSAKVTNKSSRLLGVSWHKKSGKWKSQIRINGKIHHIGYFSNALCAHAAYIEAKRLHHAGNTL